MSGLWLVSYLLLWGLVLVLALVLVSVLRHVGQLYDALDRQPSQASSRLLLKAGAEAPAVTLTSLNGTDAPSATWLTGAVAVIVVSPHCGPCRGLLDALAAGSDGLDLAPAQRRLVVGVGSADDLANLVATTGLPDSVSLLHDPNHVLQDRWGVRVTPTILIFDDRNRYVRHMSGFTQRVPVLRGEAATT